jgi:nickel transport protein
MDVIDRFSMLRLLAPLLVLSSVVYGTGLAPAKAHQIESALHYLDGDLQLSSSFSNGEPTQGAVVRLLNADGTPGQELGRTDADGRLSLDLSTVGNGTVDLQVDGGPGHRDYLELPIHDGAVNVNEVVMFPFSLVLVGLLVSVRRRND